MLYQFLVDLAMPACITIFARPVLEVVSFDLFQLDPWIDEFYSFPAHPTPITQKFGLLGFESFYFVRNVGALGVILLIGTVVVLSSYILTRLDHGHPRYPFFRSVVNVFFLDGIFTTMKQTYLVLLLCCLINLRAGRGETEAFGVEASRFLTWFSLTVLCVFTLFQLVHRSPTMRKLLGPVVRDNWKRLGKVKAYEDAGLVDEPGWIVYLPSYLLVRKAAFVLVLLTQT